MCTNVQKQWEGYAALGLTLNQDNKNFEEVVQGMGFETTTGENGGLTLQDGIDTFTVYLDDNSSILNNDYGTLRYQIDHKDENGNWVKIRGSFKIEDDALEYIADPDALESKFPWVY